MKHPSLLDANARFTAPLRYYHRSSPTTYRTWDEWVDGKAKSRSKTWLKVLLIVIALLVLGGIIIGLIIELR